MEQNYLDQIQKYLNNCNIQNDSNENICLNKDQLLECFQMLLKSKDQSYINSNSNSNTNINEKNKEEYVSQSNTNKTQDSSSKKLNNISQKKNTNNYDDTPLPALKNKEKSDINKLPSKYNNVDDMPIKGGLNFNELLEKELSKENNNDNYNNENIEPKFKYVPKKRNDIISIPTKTKKYNINCLSIFKSEFSLKIKWKKILI